MPRTDRLSSGPSKAHADNYTNTTQIAMQPLQHRNREQIALRFAYDRELKDLVRGYPAVLWTQTHGCFYIPRKTK